MAGFIVKLTSKFSPLKSAIHPVLTRLLVWLHPHPLAFTQLDIVPLGFILLMHPRFHAPARISDELHDIIFDDFNFISDDI
jgi:hypothetical protein